MQMDRPLLNAPNIVVAALANNARAGSVALPAPPKIEPTDWPCVHRSIDHVREVKCRPCQNMGVDSLPVYSCAIHHVCVIRGYAPDLPKLCSTCEERKPPLPKMQDDAPVVSKRSKVVPVRGIVANRQDQPADHLAEQFAGGACVLVCGGPSVAQMDLSVLDQRGVFVAAVSQVAATHVRPHAWFSVDACTTYHEAIWRDPQIMKFVARNWTGNSERIPMQVNGEWLPSKTPAWKCPNVWFYDRGDRWAIDEFLTAPYAMWQTLVDGKPKKSVMLVAIRLLHWLGFRTVYLIGCDFEMRRDAQYAFPATKGEGAYRSNNRTYNALNETFVALRPQFEAAGLRVFNATTGGRLDAFERVTFEEAVAGCRDGFPRSIDVSGLYH